MRTLIATVLVLLAVSAAAETPKLTGRVNDPAGLLSASEHTDLERKLADIEQTEGHPQVAVLLPLTLGGADIESFAHETFHVWKLGQAGKDNGILIIIAPKERKWRIEVGYGLEGAIPDGRAKQIIAQAMDPHLKGGKTGFYEAFNAAVNMVALDLTKERKQATPTAPASSYKDDDRIALYGIGTLVLFGGVIVCVALGTSSARRRREQEEEALRELQYRRDTEAFRKRVGSGQAHPISAVAAGVIIGAAAAKGRPSAPAKASKPYRSSSPSYSPPSPSRSSSSDSDSSWSSSPSSPSSSDSPSFSGGGGDSGGGGASGGD